MVFKLQLKFLLNDNLMFVVVLDFCNKQDYFKVLDVKCIGYYMGGVNCDSVDCYVGSVGEGVMIILVEIDVWNISYVNLLLMSFSFGKMMYVVSYDYDIVLVGIMVVKDMGIGICGLVWKSWMGYVVFVSNNFYNLIFQLKVGDVVQIGI